MNTKEILHFRNQISDFHLKKLAIFDPLQPWIYGWDGQKWPKAMRSHVLGGDMAHNTVSRLVPCPGTSLPLRPDFHIKKLAIFDPLQPWIYGWGGQKWSIVMLSHVLGGDMAHKKVSRLVPCPGTSLPL